MSSAADKLNKLKVADLKPILQKVGLPVSGKKNELVDRILASKEALAAAGLGDEPAPAAQEDMNADLPDLPAEEPIVSNTVPTPAHVPAPVAAVPAAEPPAAATTTTAPEAPKLDDEAERRRKRAERFGIPFVDEKKKAAPPAKPASGAGASKASGAKPAAAPAAPASPEEDRLRKRAERFGLPVATAGAASNGRTKGAAKETAPAPAAVVDPAEEEKKRKRAERFGKVSGAPVEKKAKADS
ncbi:hypothetical protein FS837_004778 [Tulasnella sp. UAMH 9824]|nr:hypothetical protein FS837_004778 [Tulasnella sp. UAMH 9824]